jgi:Holliday junction resolvase
MSRRAAKVDANHAQVVSALQAAGAKVLSLAAVGDGVPDLLVGFRATLLLIEVKDGDKSPSRRGLTEKQKTFHAEWAGLPLSIAYGPDDALRAIGVLK